ncbi:MAG: molybdate ABC transporter substrate-binding protein [Verrucomicrobiaceae bacterium]|nr:molybdate ABC transporter substrate-binding protein [Verrucomicrobiaceae bacterium]
MNRAKVVFWILVACLLGPLFILIITPYEKGDPLLVYCAAGMRKPMAVIARKYEEQYGVKVELQFAGSGTLLANAEASGKGDLYLAGDMSYIRIGQEKGLVREALAACHLTAGLAVRQGNPLKISSLADLSTHPDLRIVIANPEAASIGKFTKKILNKNGLWDAISSKALAMKPTVNEVANDVKLGAADVAVIWDAVANQYPELQFINVAEFDGESKKVAIGVLDSANVPSDALRFARYATARDEGLEFFSEMGYRVVEGDKWQSQPELLFFSGAMLNPAIRDSMARFKEREGVNLKFVPNGCGILVSQMKAGARPDAYFSCDVSFMEEVEAFFSKPKTVSSNDMVILVSNDVRGKIRKLSDLSLPGMRVGLAHPENSALGALTVRLLENEKVEIGDNKELDSATGDFLVNQLRAGSLDAVIVYRSNAKANPATLKGAHIVDINNDMAIARQPFAIGLNSDHKHLASRLFRALVNDMGRKQFLDYGFEWELSE